MRRLVVISGKSKIIATFAAIVFSLTSIHLAATARIASLKREQEQLERSAMQSAVISQDSRLKAGQAARQTPASMAFADPQSTLTLSARNVTPARPATTAVASSSSPVPRRQIIISIADRQLAVIDGGQILKTYPIAVGARGTPSPDGDFLIINHAKDPIYRGGDTEIPSGKDNPLGSRWMGLNLQGYGIHGTNVQSSVGKAVSHGCFRMRKQDVEELYTLVQVGDTVMVRRERDAMIAKVFATPTTTQPAAILAAAAPNSEIQVAAAAATAMVETTEQ
ncbi:MAG TPA: L,D-transpeptidase [Candidatus Angelobacter sp.]|jgi:lipoprotein-anchoring transpeptidase ErfK/SrfK|nr:L,D-transpeptidase [Candidatus Angelobacter sp.]